MTESVTYNCGCQVVAHMGIVLRIQICFTHAKHSKVADRSAELAHSLSEAQANDYNIGWGHYCETCGKFRQYNEPCECVEKPKNEEV